MKPWEKYGQEATIAETPKPWEKYGGTATQEKSSVGLSRLSEVEEKISQREPYYKGLLDVVTKKPEYVKESLARGKIPAIEHPFQTALDVATVIPRKFLGVPLQAAASGAKLAEGAVASAGLAIQRGKPEEILPDVFKTIKGERQAELGDIPRAAGVPEPVSSAIGLLSTMGLLTPTATFKSAGKMIAKPGVVAKEAGAEVSAVGKILAKPFKAAGEKTVQTFKTLLGPNQSQLKADIGKIKSEVSAAQSAKASINLGIDEKALAEKAIAESQLKEIKDTFAENNKRLSIEFNKARGQSVEKIREVLRESNSALSANYRVFLDTVENDLIKSGQQMTKGELDDILNKVFIRAQEGAVPESSTFQAVRNLASKYKIEQGIDEVGNVITKNAGEVIPFKDLVADVKTINKGLSGRFKQKIGATPDDKILDFFHEEYGKWITEKAPQFAAGQAEYARIAAVKNEANRIFKPYDFEKIKTDQAMNLLKKFGLAKEGEQPAAENLLKAIQKGYQFQGKQIGGQEGIFADVEEFGAQIKVLGEKKAALTDAVTQRMNTMKFSNAAQKLAARKEALSRIDNLIMQEAAARTKLKSRADADRVAKWILGLGLTSAGLGKYGLSRLSEH